MFPAYTQKSLMIICLGHVTARTSRCASPESPTPHGHCLHGGCGHHLSHQGQLSEGAGQCGSGIAGHRHLFRHTDHLWICRPDSSPPSSTAQPLCRHDAPAFYAFANSDLRSWHLLFQPALCAAGKRCDAVHICKGCSASGLAGCCWQNAFCLGISSLWLLLPSG